MTDGILNLIYATGFENISFENDIYPWVHDRVLLGTLLRWKALYVSPSISFLLWRVENLPSTVSVHTLGCLVELLSGLLHRKAEVEARVGAALEAALTLPFLANLVLRALSFATQHDEVVLLGKLADVFTSKINVGACLSTKKLPSAGHKAIQNFLRETARQPSEFLFLLRLRNHVQQKAAVADQRRPFLADVEEQWTVFSSQAIPLDLRTRFATIGLQFLELSEAATRQWHHVGPPDIFS